MITKQEALALLAEVQAEIATEIGEPVISSVEGASAAEPGTEQAMKKELVRLKVSVENAERRAADAEARARAAEKAARVAKRSGAKTTGATRFRSAHKHTGLVVVKVDGKNYPVKPGNTIEVSDGVVDKPRPTEASKGTRDTSKYVW